MRPARSGLPHEGHRRDVIRRTASGRSIFAAPLLTLMAVLATALLLAVLTAAVALPLTVALALTVAAVAVSIAAVPARLVRSVMRSRQLDARPGPPFGLRQFKLDQFFDVAQERHLLVVAERDRDPLRTGASGSPDPMNVAFGNVGQ